MNLEDVALNLMVGGLEDVGQVGKLGNKFPKLRKSEGG